MAFLVEQIRMQALLATAQALQPSAVAKSHDAALPPGWSVLHSRTSGMPYYFNPAVGSQYEAPTPAPLALHDVPPRVDAESTTAQTPRTLMILDAAATANGPQQHPPPPPPPPKRGAFTNPGLQSTPQQEAVPVQPTTAQTPPIGDAAAATTRPQQHLPPQPAPPKRGELTNPGLQPPRNSKQFQSNPRPLRQRLRRKHHRRPRSEMRPQQRPGPAPTSASCHPHSNNPCHQR